MATRRMQSGPATGCCRAFGKHAHSSLTWFTEVKRCGQLVKTCIVIMANWFFVALLVVSVAVLALRIPKEEQMLDEAASEITFPKAPKKRRATWNAAR